MVERKVRREREICGGGGRSTMRWEGGREHEVGEGRGSTGMTGRRRGTETGKGWYLQGKKRLEDSVIAGEGL